jgi:pimeloyl-ACP methyl ester carboxylesterase
MKIDSFSLAKNSIETDIPMLVLYSLNDGYIQIKDAVKFAEINQNVVLQEFEGARHCRLRNSNVELYERTLKDFVAKL